MSRIRGQNTGPEKVLRDVLWARGLRYRLSPRSVLGRPDIVFGKAKVAVFVDGCFWHGCPWHYNKPKNDAKRWEAKYYENKARDKRVNAALRKSGWRVIRLWEHDLQKDIESCVDKIEALVKYGSDE